MQVADMTALLAVCPEIESQHDGQDELFGSPIENQRVVDPLLHRRDGGLVEQPAGAAQHRDVDDAALPVDDGFEDHHAVKSRVDRGVGIDRLDTMCERGRLDIAADSYGRLRRRGRRWWRRRNVAQQSTDDAPGDAARNTALDTSGNAADLARLERSLRLDGG